MKLHEAIGLEIERRENVMTFDEWIQKWRDAQPDGKLPHELEEGAEEAWDYQQARIEALEKGLQAVAQLIEESSGVSGLHMNGDVAPWSDLQTGGRFEEWLIDFDAALLQEPTK